MRIGIDLGGTKIEGVALDGSREVARLRIDAPRDSYVATVDAIVSLVAALEQIVPISALRQPRGGASPLTSESRVPDPESRLPAGARRAKAGVPSVGIGIPGAIEPSTGLVKNANSTWLIGQPLLADLEVRLGRPLRMANDANCFAMSEAADGAGADAEVVFGVIAGTGVGAGIVVRGELLTGANAIAGEWGHNPLPWAGEDERPGPVCYCGRRGCVETFLSGPALAADHAQHTGEQLLSPEIVARAAAGDPGAEASMARYEARMARALAGIINVLDPDVIVLGGGMSNIERLYVNVPRLWAEFVFSCGSNEIRTRLLRARHGDASGVRGAAWLWPQANASVRR